MTPERLDELQALADAADAGPWESKEDPPAVFPAIVKRGDKPGQYEDLGHIWYDANSEFIAAARTAIPELVAEVRLLREKLSLAGSIMEDVRTCPDVPKHCEGCNDMLADFEHFEAAGIYEGTPELEKYIEEDRDKWLDSLETCELEEYIKDRGIAKLVEEKRDNKRK